MLVCFYIALSQPIEVRPILYLARFGNSKFAPRVGGKSELLLRRGLSSAWQDNIRSISRYLSNDMVCCEDKP